jgi:hypothetical protein
MEVLFSTERNGQVWQILRLGNNYEVTLNGRYVYSVTLGEMNETIARLNKGASTMFNASERISLAAVVGTTIAAVALLTIPAAHAQASAMATKPVVEYAHTTAHAR